jgi:DNA polymerase-3 subunit chi
MTQVDFYILQGNENLRRYRTACRLVEKAYALGHRVHIHTDSAVVAKQLDDLLWTFRDRSFIPHEIAPQNPDPVMVTIGHSWIPNQCDVLINLASEVPEFFSRFQRVAEIIDQDQDRRHSGREHYRYYRDRGYSLTHHELNS